MHSGEVLLALDACGILREDAYRIVQRSAMATWTMLGQPDAKGFRANLLADPDVAGRIEPSQVDAAMGLDMHLAMSTTFSIVCSAVIEKWGGGGSRRLINAMRSGGASGAPRSVGRVRPIQ